MKMEICLTNLGKYNEGELIYSRLVLPATTEEIQTAYDEIGVADGTMYEEAFISDYETDINGLSISEYASISELNELAEELLECANISSSLDIRMQNIRKRLSEDPSEIDDIVDSAQWL